MELRLFAAGVSLDRNKITQRAGCAVVLVAEDAGRAKYREIAHGLDSMTGSQSELRAAYLALAAVRPGARSDPVSLSVGSYPAQILERRGDSYAVTPRSNERLVEQLRVLAGQFPRLTVSSRRSDEFVRAGELARVSAQDQSQLDTGSQDRN